MQVSLEGKVAGEFYGWPPIKFELRFEDGYADAQDWLNSPATWEELDRVCQKARTQRQKSNSADRRRSGRALVAKLIGLAASNIFPIGSSEPLCSNRTASNSAVRSARAKHARMRA
jgi:hypothetical protein